MAFKITISPDIIFVIIAIIGVWISTENPWAVFWVVFATLKVFKPN